VRAATALLALACSSEPLPTPGCTADDVAAETAACAELVALDCGSEHVYFRTRVWCEAHIAQLERVCL
jgi:hypothetical protein